MKITVEDMDNVYYPQGKKFVYEDKINLGVIADDWDYFFDNLRQHRDYLKLRTARCDTIGGQISLQAQVDKLNKLFEKYSEFITISEHWRHEM
jgi:hypothetical protein